MLTLPTFNKWLTALRSSSYSQSFRGLHPNPDCFCALGVLADILTHEYPDTYHWNGRCLQTFHFKSSYVIPESLLSSPKQCEVIIRNDEQARSFPEIADYLEQNRKEFIHVDLAAV